MYNGIGLTTTRGSGTNGYVQRNLSYIKPSKENVDYAKETEIKKAEALVNRGPNPDILLHERKRQVEVKCLEMRDLMEDQGYADEEIESKVNEYRILLRKKLDLEKDDVSAVTDAHGRPLSKETHALAQLRAEKNARFRDAFGIKDKENPEESKKEINVQAANSGGDEDNNTEAEQTGKDSSGEESPRSAGGNDVRDILEGIDKTTLSKAEIAKLIRSELIRRRQPKEIDETENKKGSGRERSRSREKAPKHQYNRRSPGSSERVASRSPVRYNESRHRSRSRQRTLSNADDGHKGPEESRIRRMERKRHEVEHMDYASERSSNRYSDRRRDREEVPRHYRDSDSRDHRDKDRRRSSSHENSVEERCAPRLKNGFKPDDGKVNGKENREDSPSSETALRGKRKNRQPSQSPPRAKKQKVSSDKVDENHVESKSHSESKRKRRSDVKSKSSLKQRTKQKKKKAKESSSE